MFRRLCACVLIASPAAMFGADKTLELQRDIATLQEAVKQLQRSQDERLTKIELLVTQGLGSSNDANKAVAVIQSGLQQSLRDIQDKMVPPVAGLSTRMDQMASDFRTLEGAVQDLNAALTKIQTQLTDVNNGLKVIQAPPAAPPAQPGAPPGGNAAAAAPGIPSVSAIDLYAAAERDYNGGQLDLALQEYEEFLKQYGNTAQAPAAQFYIGYIHYSQKDYEKAAQDFDVVLEKFSSDNVRAPEAAYYKGLSLKQIPGHRTDAVNEFLQLIRDYPDNQYAKRACTTELPALGRNCGPPKAPAKAPAKKKK